DGTGTRVIHHENGIEARRRYLMTLVIGDLFSTQITQHFVRDAVRHFRPDIDDFVVTLAVGDQAVLILLFDLAHVVMGFFDQRFFTGRNNHVFDGNGNSRFGRILVTDVFQTIGENVRRLISG